MASMVPLSQFLAKDVRFSSVDGCYFKNCWILEPRVRRSFSGNYRSRRTIAFICGIRAVGVRTCVLLLSPFSFWEVSTSISTMVTQSWEFVGRLLCTDRNAVSFCCSITHSHTISYPEL